MSEPETTSRNSLRAQTLRQQKRMRRMRGLLAGLLLAGLCAWGGWMWASSAPSNSHAAKTVTIPRGANRLAIGNLLVEQGLIRSSYVFMLQTRMEHAEIKAGKYRLTPNMDMDEVMKILRRGPNATVEGLPVTIPEGYTLEQIAEEMQAKGVSQSELLLQMATDKAYLAGIHEDFALPSQTLEGYLFPDTYSFKYHSQPNVVLEEMLRNFGRRFADAHQQEITASGHSLHEIVTIASLIEREARVEQDRARIAGVIENRLRRKMRLQIDATVLYALGYHKDRVLYRDLTVKSPYNTYRHTGLPPGPIANPGLPSLMAALHPETNVFLYYVARPDGTHLFSRTPKEHEAAKRQARQERRR